MQESSEAVANVSMHPGMNLTAVIELFPPMKEKTSGLFSRISQILALRSLEPVRNMLRSFSDTSIDSISLMCPSNIDRCRVGLLRSHTPTKESEEPDIM